MKSNTKALISQEKPQTYTFFDLPVWEQFVRPGEIVEVRIPKVYGKNPAWGNEWARGTVSGYFDDHKAFCYAVKNADKGQHGGIYFSLQNIDPRLIGRAFNRLKPSDTTTSDNNVISYRWLPVDIDPDRPAGISSSDEELRLAINGRDIVERYISEEYGKYGFQKPIKAISGNGAHLLYRLPDLPNTPENRDFVHGILSDLDENLSIEGCKIDQTVFNPARIWKLYGTQARKGDEVPAGPHRAARPYRLSYIEDLGGGN